MVQRQCLRCNLRFTVTPQRRRYCSDACVEAACKRRCERCGKTFSVPKGQPSHIKKHCSDDCRDAAVRLGATARGNMAGQRRSEQSRTFVTCIWPECPRKGELIPLPRYKAKQMSYHRHPECREAYRRSCNGGTKPRKGAELICEDCKEPIGYRPAFRLAQKYCGICANRRNGGYKPRTGDQLRQCAFGGCPEMVRVTPGQIKKSKTGAFYCSSAHYGLANRAPRIHCRSCGRERKLLAGRHPRTLDLSTLTFECKACRPPQTIMRGFTCARAGCGKYFRRRVPIDAPADLIRLCTDPCRKKYHHVERRCDVCDKVIPARRNKAHCSRACYKQAKKDQPNPHYRPSQAEIDTLEVVRERGRLPIRAIAALKGISPTAVHKALRKHNIT